MPNTYIISHTEATKIANIRAGIKDKQVDKRLRSVQMRGEGKKNPEIAMQLETATDMISRWVSLYAKGGFEALMPKKRGSYNRNMSHAEEAELLASFDKLAVAGQIVETVI